jgi:LuxR family maltose regulon positive regulatory protein
MAEIDSTIVPATRHVSRPAVLRRVHEATRRPVTLIRAPAGYGKSVVLGQLATATDTVVAALTLDLQTSPDEVARAFAAALEATPERDGIRAFVVDRADAASAAVCREIEQLADALPEQLRLVLASRHTLPLPLGRWRARGRLSEIGPDDLRFGPADTADLLERYGRGSATELARDLTERAEGWPAGIDLLVRAEVAAEGFDPAARRLCDQLLAGLPTDLRELLLATSVLERVSADLARAITGSAAAGRLLRDVEERALFVAPLDDDRTWFRYNPLFAGLLQGELARRDPGRTAELHRRAGAWFEERRELRSAVLHWVAAGDVDRAFWLVNENPYDGVWDTTLDVPWDELFPAAWLADDPTRMLHFATLLGRSGRLAGALHWLEQARAAFATVPADDLRHGVRLSVEALWSAATLNARVAVDLGREAVEWPPLHPRHDLRSRVKVAVATALVVLDEPDEVERLCDELDTPATSEIMRSVVAPGLRARVAWRRGELDTAERLAGRVLATAQALGVPGHPGLRECHLVLGCVLAERGELTAGAREVRRAVAIADRFGWPATAATYRVELARIRAAEAGVAAGLEVVAATRDSLRGRLIGPEVAALVDACEAELRLRAGDLDRAEALAAGAPPGFTTDVLRLQLALARGDHATVAAALPALSPTNPRDHLRLTILTARLAATTTATPVPGGVDTWLATVAAEGAAGGFGLLVAGDGAELVAGIERVAPWARDLVARVRACRGLGAAGGPGSHLSARERTVLRSLAGGATHAEIGHELALSPNTVKTHARAIYRKLGVRSRAEALDAARRLDIL